jgi:hypothetical protein
LQLEVLTLEIQATGTRKCVVNVPLVYKPYASLLARTIRGVVSVSNFDYCSLTASSVTRVGTNSKAYTITSPVAHPTGTSFAVIVAPYTG